MRKVWILLKTDIINSLSLNEYEQPSKITSSSLEKLWNNTIADIGIFGLFKNKDFRQSSNSL